MVNKKVALLGLVFLSSYLAFHVLGSRIVWAASESVKPTVFWKTNEKPVVHEYVWFPCDHPKLTRPIKSCIKVIRCNEGQQLKTIGTQYWCDEEVLGEARKKDMKGLPLEQYHFSGRIPAGKAFVMGESHNSFDSRYLGLIETSKMTRLSPIL